MQNDWLEDEMITSEDRPSVDFKLNASGLMPQAVNNLLSHKLWVCRPAFCGKDRTTGYKRLPSDESMFAITHPARSPGERILDVESKRTTRPE
jgi:hypothetical protein